jgi:hypothetical protein
MQQVWTAAGFLCLAALAEREYCRLGGQYVNSSAFSLVVQRFTEPVDDIVYSARRRDGETTWAGYKHGKVVFSMPVECHQISSPARVDQAFAQALDQAEARGSPMARRLLPAVTFFNMANTDSVTVLREAEIILTGAAFEQLLDADSARSLQCKVGTLLSAHGSVTVTSALSKRPGIAIDKRYERAQRQWFVHRKWVEELHQLRSAVVHGQDLQARAWGWTLSEHLMMGAFVFPLLVKVCLAEHGHYRLTQRDEAWCKAVDEILVQDDWFSPAQGSNVESCWSRALRKVESHEETRRAIEDALREQGLSS